MKRIVIDMNDPNETVMFSRSNLGNLCFDTFFERLEAKLSPCVKSDKKSELLHSNQIVELNYTLVDNSNDAPIDFSSYTE